MNGVCRIMKKEERRSSRANYDCEHEADFGTRSRLVQSAWDF